MMLEKMAWTRRGRRRNQGRVLIICRFEFDELEISGNSKPPLSFAPQFSILPLCCAVAMPGLVWKGIVVLLREPMTTLIGACCRCA
jgi:hypothetical protein